MSPWRETNPYVGFSPTTPQNAAGWRTDPPVSDPSAAKQAPDETAAALPPELPPGTKHASFFFSPSLVGGFFAVDPVVRGTLRLCVVFRVMCYVLCCVVLLIVLGLVCCAC